jgi:hypothetical protein
MFRDANGGYHTRNVLGYADANKHTEHPVVSLMKNKRTSLIRVGQCVLELGNVILKQIH